MVGSLEQIGFVVPPRSCSCIDALTGLAQGYFMRSYVKLLVEAACVLKSYCTNQLLL